MNLLPIFRAVVCAAIVTLCVAGAELFAIKTAAGQEISPLTPGSAVYQPVDSGRTAKPFLPESATLGSNAQHQQIYRPGLRNSFSGYPLSATEMTIVLAQLRHKTGFASLRFDEAGFLTIDDRSQISGGSEAARELLLAAIDGTQSILLQSHNRSSRVAFARASEGAKYTAWQSTALIESRLIEIDFIDFKKLRGHRKAIEAFDPGFVILHELCHIVLSLHDPSEKVGEAGDCETYVNRIRRELGSPERQQYAATASMKHLSLSTPTAKVATLVFAQARTGSDSQERTKAKKYFAWWISQDVGGKGVFPTDDQ